MDPTYILAFVAGAVIGGALIWFLERRAASAKQAALTDTESRLRDTFKSLSADVLKDTNRSFLDLAKSELSLLQQSAQHDLATRQHSIDELVKPLQEKLKSVDEKIQALDVSRAKADAALDERVKNLVEVQSNLQNETQNLVLALRTPAVRGRWGELHLKNAVEMSGMVAHCDFLEQQSAYSVEEDGGILRPDMIIRLPGGKTVIVDSKVPLEAFLNAVEANSEAVRTAQLDDHVRQVRQHMEKLSRKKYWNQFDTSPEFVIMYLPGENIYSAALQRDSELIKAGIDKKIFIATPTTLIALLHAVAHGWTQESLSRNAEEISSLGKDLYSRISSFASHMGSLRNGLQNAVEAHNRAVGSLETRVLPTARTLKELSVSAEPDIEDFRPIEKAPRAIQAPELLLYEE
jgi:DNA recombination protein RmuC